MTGDGAGSVSRNSAFPLRPKDAATLILIDRAGPSPKVLLGKRHHRHVFMPGKYVFPGGRVETADRLMGTASELASHTEAHLMRHDPRASQAKARALALAAIRETFEETGLMLGVRKSEPPGAPGRDWIAFDEAKVHPDLAPVHFVARAVTPPQRVRRFDTRFFATEVDGVAHEVENRVGPDHEFVELVWVPIRETWDLDLPTITRVVLEDLDDRINAGFHRDQPVPYYGVYKGLFARRML